MLSALAPRRSRTGRVLDGGGRRPCRPPGPREVFDAVRKMAGRAADLGADALLVHPPTAFRDGAIAMP